MTVLIEFTLPDDQYQLDLALLGPKLAAAVMDLDETLREVCKYDDAPKRDAADRWRATLWEALQGHGITREMIER